MMASLRGLSLLSLPVLGWTARIARGGANVAEEAYTEAMREAAADDKVVCEKWLASLPATMRAAYPDATFLNSGVRGCGFLATDGETGAPVVLKVAKGWPGNPVGKWRYECNKMRWMHESACQAGPAALELAQTYLPTCIDFMPHLGPGDDPVPYFVMHAAPTTQFQAVKSLHLGEGARKEAFAQLVAAVYSMHGAGWYHNDMHSRNVMIGEAEGGHPELAVIDFGKANEKPETGGYHHDASSLADHLGKMCGRMPECLRTKWNVDPVSVKAFEEWLELAKQHKPEQGVEKIFNTPFVQEYTKFHAARPYVTKTTCSGGVAPSPQPPATVQTSTPKPPSEQEEEDEGDDEEETTGQEETTPRPPARSPECKSPANPGCNKLSGLCCPTKKGMMLACCKR